jgi:ABC-type transport system substrate-binding protein
MKRNPSRIKGRATLPLLAVLLSFLASCEYKAPKDPETLVWHLGAEPDILNPITSTDAYASRIEGLVYDSLIERDNETLEWKPKMAESWEIAPDKMHFTFHLRQGIHWQDGGARDRRRHPLFL